MRELFNIDINKLKEEDKRFLLNKNSSEILHYEQMLINNKLMMIAFFALFTGLVSLVVSSNYIDSLTKIIFVSLMSISSIYLIITFINARKNILLDKFNLKLNYDELFKHHFAYATRRID